MKLIFHINYYKLIPALAEKVTEYYINKGVNELNKTFSSSKGLGTTLTNNEIKYIIKVINSLENRGILLKGTTKKIISQKGGFLNVLRPLMTSGLPSAADEAIQKKIHGSGRPTDLASRATALIISNEEMEDIMKIVKSLEESRLLIKGISETIKNEVK